MKDMRSNFLPKFIEICMETPCWCPSGKKKMVSYCTPGHFPLSPRWPLWRGSTVEKKKWFRAKKKILQSFTPPPSAKNKQTNKQTLKQTILYFRWLTTVFDTCTLFTFFSKTLDPLVTKNGREKVNNTNVTFLIV